ncbi:MAG: ribonuclease HII [Deltaproteobacteria bacterium]|nr:ribonuclease HII [Deltaproteobacteria bacterium]
MPELAGRLKTMPQPERLLYAEGYRHVAGTDEAGRGPLAGPVVAAAVILPPGWHHPGIKDSKKLSARARAELFGIITGAAVSWNWAAVEACDIDRINILQASLLAMRTAVLALDPVPDYLLIDGPHGVPGPLPHAAITRGDQKSLVIGAASIVAKVVRDAIMEKYDRLFPAYHFSKNKGYGTAAHMRALAQHGQCSLHRRSFKMVVSPEQT